MLWVKGMMAGKQHLTVDNNTAVGVDGLARDRSTVGVCEEDEASGNLRGLRGTANRRAELFLSLVVHSSRDEGCPDGTGSDGVDTDATTDVLVVETAGERDDGTLG
jgi:hypothetical protein